MDGILPLWKPAGMTSHDCVMRIRRLLQTKKVGHTGTLDPDAEGVLPLCIGKATKLVPFMTNTSKTYLAEVILGQSTDTEDASGVVIEQKIPHQMPTNENIEHVLNMFTGDIVQIPPMYSAVRVNGKRLYEYARAQETVERPSRHVTIEHLEQTSPVDTGDHSFGIKVVCSKGTYIRTLCVDIGKALGYPAHMGRLIRMETGSIAKKATYTFEQIEQAVKTCQVHSLLLDMRVGIGNMDQLRVDEATRQKVLFGQKLPSPSQKMSTNPFAIIAGSELIAIYQYHPDKDGEIKPVRVFH
ncbi:tRNA pseudouridine(55) synthase TruB [Lentibacillus saliphilus]|uniref:tRNA pseudouridine(55) synthase TruB n=1 Tax=Lentibacillus saliphilus TaxID=2737028 RepID=UPI001C2F7F8D|nr:tRNA pseudouridine(55) synthase TruB [Lentibacillus saliphilus]